MPRLLVAVVLILVMCPPLLGQEPSGEGASVSDYLSGKLPPIETQPVDPAADPTRFGEAPPPEITFVPWNDWAVNQRISPIRRFVIETNIGQLSPTSGSATVGGDAFGFEQTFELGQPSLGLEAGYRFAPFLAVTLQYFSIDLDGTEVMRNVGGTDYTLYPGSWTINGVLASARIMFPFTLIGPRLFLFNRAPLTLGLVPFFRFGIGAASLGSVGGSYYNHTSGQMIPVTYFGNSIGPSLLAGGGLGWRWSWGVVSFEVDYLILPTPRASWSVISGTSSLHAAGFLLSTGVYF